ncbi:hypothetical protein C0991_003842 [Blastosporella zonata]|nr:hypothetical protein C0991_003842 [Blastosporella zonata]
MDFWRGEAYQAFFDYLESKGGFYYEDTDTIPSSIARKVMTGHEDDVPAIPTIVSMRYILLVLFVIVSLHYILSFSNETYGHATSLNTIKEKISGYKNQPPYNQPVPEDYYYKSNVTTPPARKANAAFVLLARNSDLNGVVSSMKQMEDRFNKKFQYPYVFLNDQPFDEAFKKRVMKLTDAKVEFGLIPKEHWVQPDSIDESRASASREDMTKNHVIYGGKLSSAIIQPDTKDVIFRECSVSLLQNGVEFDFDLTSGTAICVASTPEHELLKPYKYYWRVEPDVKFFCDLDYDPFLIMQDQNKLYGFTVSLYEYEKFTSKNADLIPAGNAMSFISDDGGETYNRCHFWSNFEIADLDLWRGEAYSKFFDFLDEKGGFYYERWGDAPVHSIGAALFAKKEQIAIDTNLSSIAHKGKRTHEENVGVRSRRTLTMNGTLA